MNRNKFPIVYTYIYMIWYKLQDVFITEQKYLVYLKSAYL